MYGFLSCQCIWLAHVQLFIDQDLKFFLYRAAFHPSVDWGLPQPLHLAFLNFMKFIVPLFQPVQVPLDGILSLQHVTATLAGDAHHSTVRIIDGVIKPY